MASLSSAVTQGAENYLIKALQDVGQGRWFTVLERVGLDNLIKERQMIRQMREQYQGKEAKALPPMLFAGIIMEGGIVGYDSNTLTGGHGMRIFGIGAQTQYQSDTVTVTLRTVSVSTGEVLTSITVTKTVLSYMDKITVVKFISDPTNALTGTNALSVEGEFGGSINESINKAIDIAVQAAVVTTIKEGARKGMWSFQQERPVVQIPEAPVVKIPKPETTEDMGPVSVHPVLSTEKMRSLDSVRIYEKKSALKEAPFGAYLLYPKDTEFTVSDTEFDGVVKVIDQKGKVGYVKKEMLK